MKTGIVTMNETGKKVLTVIGILAGIYIFVKYILPLILKILGFLIGAVFSVILWAVTGLAVLFLLVYILRLFRPGS